MSGLWKNDPKTPEGKYPVLLRRDGSQVEWPYFVIGAKDPNAPWALRAYADSAERLGMDPAFVADVRQLANDFFQYRTTHGDGDPDAPPHRKDDPATLARAGKGA